MPSISSRLFIVAAHIELEVVRTLILLLSFADKARDYNQNDEASRN